MIKSMTAFAREENKQDFGVITWELRSVNHRYLEPYIRLPEDFRALEGDVRDSIKNAVNRGKVECTLSIKGADDQGQNVVVNTKTLQQLSLLCASVETHFNSLSDMSALDVLKWPGIMDAPKLEIDSVSQVVIQTLNAALAELVETRAREGQKLGNIIEQRLDQMALIVDEVKTRIPVILEGSRNRLIERFKELSVQLDNDRLEQEMVLITQKADVDEELTRLETHLDEVRRIVNLTEDKPMGRRLDFLMQELNREANTLCSKSMDSETTKAGIDLKVYIEQMREQVQNIE